MVGLVGRCLMECDAGTPLSPPLSLCYCQEKMDSHRASLVI